MPEVGSRSVIELLVHGLLRRVIDMVARCTLAVARVSTVISAGGILYGQVEPSSIGEVHTLDHVPEGAVLVGYREVHRAVRHLEEVVPVSAICTVTSVTRLSITSGAVVVVGVGSCPLDVK